MQSVLQKAKQAVTARPLQVRVAQNAEFIELSGRRVANSQKELDAESAELEKAVGRQEQLRQKVEAVPDVADTVANGTTEVIALKARLAKVEAERDVSRETPPRPQKVHRTDRRGFPVIPMMPDLVPADGTHIQVVGWGCTNDGDDRKGGPVTQDQNRDARHRLRGMRVEEASNPGPTLTQIDNDQEPMVPSVQRHEAGGRQVLPR